MPPTLIVAADTQPLGVLAWLGLVMLVVIVGCLLAVIVASTIQQIRGNRRHR